MVVYRKYPEKAIKDTYTPFVIKLQTLLAALSLPVTLSAFVYSHMITVTAILFLAIIVSSAPFSIKTFKKDPLVGFISPAVVLGRAIAFALGSFCSLFYKEKRTNPSSAVMKT